jgi:TRAP-type uncharacterized transport system substrate-binding protein
MLNIESIITLTTWFQENILGHGKARGFRAFSASLSLIFSTVGFYFLTNWLCPHNNIFNWAIQGALTHSFTKDFFSKHSGIRFYAGSKDGMYYRLAQSLKNSSIETGLEIIDIERGSEAILGKLLAGRSAVGFIDERHASDYKKWLKVYDVYEERVHVLYNQQHWERHKTRFRAKCRRETGGSYTVPLELSLKPNDCLRSFFENSTIRYATKNIAGQKTPAGRLILNACGLAPGKVEELGFTDVFERLEHSTNTDSHEYFVAFLTVGTPLEAIQRLLAGDVNSKTISLMSINPEVVARINSAYSESFHAVSFSASGYGSEWDGINTMSTTAVLAASRHTQEQILNRILGWLGTMRSPTRDTSVAPSTATANTGLPVIDHAFECAQNAAREEWPKLIVGLGSVLIIVISAVIIYWNWRVFVSSLKRTTYTNAITNIYSRSMPPASEPEYLHDEPSSTMNEKAIDVRKKGLLKLAELEARIRADGDNGSIVAAHEQTLIGLLVRTQTILQQEIARRLVASVEHATVQPFETAKWHGKLRTDYVDGYLDWQGYQTVVTTIRVKKEESELLDKKSGRPTDTDTHPPSGPPGGVP